MHLATHKSRKVINSRELTAGGDDLIPDLFRFILASLRIFRFFLMSIWCHYWSKNEEGTACRPLLPKTVSLRPEGTGTLIYSSFGVRYRGNRFPPGEKGDSLRLTLDRG